MLHRYARTAKGYSDISDGPEVTLSTHAECHSKIDPFEFQKVANFSIFIFL